MVASLKGLAVWIIFILCGLGVAAIVQKTGWISNNNFVHVVVPMCSVLSTAVGFIAGCYACAEEANILD